ncbi:MAG: ester cyclase [Saprospiraceae bacterium]
MTKKTIKDYHFYFLILGLIGCSNSSEQATSEQNLEAVKNYHEIWSNGNIDDLDKIISPEFHSHFIGGFEYRGIDGAKNAVLDTRKAFPDWTEKYCRNNC